MDLQVETAKDATEAAKRGNRKTVSVKRKKSRKKAAKDATKAAVGPSKALNLATLPNTSVLQSKDQETVLDNVGKRKKKRRKKKNANEGKHVVAKRKAAGTNAKKAIGKAKLKTPRNKSADVVHHEANDRFNGPSHTDNAGNFGQFHDTESEIFDEGILNHNGRGTEAQAEPEVHDVENVHTKTIDKNLVKWEHLALIVEEYFLTANNL